MSVAGRSAIVEREPSKVRAAERFGALIPGALAACALGVLVLLATRAERWRVETRQHGLVTAQGVELDRELAQLALVPRLLADDPRTVAALTARTPAALDAANRMFERARRHSGADVVYAMDRTGLTIAASNWRDASSFVGANYGFRPYFREAIAGDEATFFAVGATTGEPGYFVARPVYGGEPDGSDPLPIGPGARSGTGPVADRVVGLDAMPETAIGVMVAKLSLDALVEAWRAQPHHSLVTDELGVVILSTEPVLLYTPGSPLDATARARLMADRRYEVSEAHRLDLPASGHGRTDLFGASQMVVSSALADEPWRLHLLLPEAPLLRRGAALAAAVAGLVLIASLLIRLFRQQRRLAAAEQRVARELERLVADRTDELEAAQRALIAASNFAMLGRMSAAINHEINQPLASLRLDLATLRSLTARAQPPLDDVREAVIDADRTVRRIGRVVETLRSVARRGSGRLASLDASRLLDEVVETVRRERPAARDILVLAPTPATISAPTTAPMTVPTRMTSADTVSVHGDVVLLQQAILNLVHNALDAVIDRPDPRVTLSLRGAGDSVIVSVEDNGPGVAPGLAERLFEPFASGSNSAGLGLGLALAHQIVTDHGGVLDHHPRAHGGSEFRLTLPR